MFGRDITHSIPQKYITRSSITHCYDNQKKKKNYKDNLGNTQPFPIFHGHVTRDRSGSHRNHRTCQRYRNRQSDVGKPISPEILCTMDEAIDMILSRDDNEHVAYSIDVYIRLDTNMLQLDGDQLLTYIRTRIEFGRTFSCHCSQDQDAQRQVTDANRRRLDSRMETFTCGGRIDGMIDKHSSYVHLDIEHSIGHVPRPPNRNDLYRDILNQFPEAIGVLTQRQFYFWRNCAFESQYKLHRVQCTSAEILIDRATSQGVQKVFRRVNTQYSGLGFVMRLFGTICGLAEVEELNVDSAFKTNRTGHELFGIVAT
ncbi:hypothetical protein BDA99DRAFT_543853, partial [Phascolomyces articulosus]